MAAARLDADDRRGQDAPVPRPDDAAEVDRRAAGGRADRVCPPGAPARRLGDIDELRPFFDLVDQADRAAAARVSVRPGPRRRAAQRRRARHTRRRTGRRRRVDDRRRGRSRSARPRHRWMTTTSRRLRVWAAPRRGRALLTILVVCAGGRDRGYIGLQAGPGRRDAGTAGAPAAPRTPRAAPAAAPPLRRPRPRRPPRRRLRPRAAAPAPADARPRRAPAAAPAPAARAAPARRDRRRRPPADSARPHSYEQLVAEADRALENGKTAKAQKLYRRGVAAAVERRRGADQAPRTCCSIRQKPLAAIGKFKRALNLSPNYPQALFGLGEAYRARGQPGARPSPPTSGTWRPRPRARTRPAARRQIRELEGQPAPSRARAGRPHRPPTAEPDRRS